MQIDKSAIHKYLFSFQMFQQIAKHKQDHMILHIKCNRNEVIMDKETICMQKYFCSRCNEQ